ncbi:MAG: hypothetical protein ABI609_00470 [Acidobacteriota bacterium]
MRRLFTTAALALVWILLPAAAAQALAVPQQTSPADGATITNWRNINFTWNLVTGAPKYGIEIQAFNLSNSTWADVKLFHGIDAQASRYTYGNFTTSDYGRWRVRSEGASNNTSWSGWRLFQFDPGISTVKQPAKVTEVSKAVALGALAQVQARVVCPAGTIVVGGGWRSGSNDSVFTSSSVQILDAWMVTFQNLTNGTRNVTAYAECLQGASGYSFDILTHSNPPPGQVGAPQATCNKGVLSGGGFITTSTDNLPFSVSPFSPTGWYVDTLNTSGSATGSVFAEAVCLVGSGATVTLALGTMHTLSGFSSINVATACASTKVALGGGWSAIHDGAAATSFRRSGNGWRAGVEDLGFNPIGNNASVYALCAKFN